MFKINISPWLTRQYYNVSLKIMNERMNEWTNAVTGTYLLHKIRNLSPGLIPEVRKICTDQRLGKYHCSWIKIRLIRGTGKQIRSVQKNKWKVWRGKPRKILQLLPSFELLNGISSTSADTKLLMHSLFSFAMSIIKLRGNWTDVTQTHFYQWLCNVSVSIVKTQLKLNKV